MTYRLFYSNPDSFLRLVNTWKNFPSGIFLAIFLPDTMVFLGKAPWRLWFLSTVAILSVFYILFVVTNLNLDSRERSRRFFEGIFLIFAISWVGDIVGLYWYGETAGPSGVIYSLLGIMYGFIISNIIVEVRVWKDSLVNFIRKSGNFMPFSLSLAIGIIFALYAVGNPSGFFSLSLNGVKVAGGVHVFCFVVGALVSAIIGITRGNKAFPRPLVAKKAMRLN
ncbi:MAG: hypothetical protein M1587_09715 [Thaumarchaeota archaeon]|nr:hypothetical protein [Nitrososphaerota archaeon]